MKRIKRKRVIAILLAIVLTAGIVDGMPVICSKAADNIKISTGTLGVQRADVLCVSIPEWKTIRDEMTSDLILEAVDDNSGIYINGERSSVTSIPYSKWGLYVDGTRFIQRAWVAGDIVHMKGTFTETVTNSLYDVELCFRCITASGTDVYSTATWELLTGNDVPAFIEITGMTSADVDGTTPFATLSVSGEMPGDSSVQQTVEVLRNGEKGNVTLQKTGDSTVIVKTADDVSRITGYISYVIPAGTEVSFGERTCIIMNDYTFYVLADGIETYLPVNMSYRNCADEETENRWTLTVNVSPAVNEKGRLGSVSATLQTPTGEATDITIENVYAGELPSELVYYLDYAETGTPAQLAAGTKLTIKRGQVKDMLKIANDLVLLWDGNNWTDKADIDDIPGDANDDRKVSPKDLVRYKKVLAESADFAEEYVSDLNKDGVTNVFDIVVLRKVLLGRSVDNLTMDYAMDINVPESGATVYPYVDKVYEFLTTEGADINDYCIAGSNGKDGSLKDTLISWDSVSQYADKYVVEYATKEDFSDKISVVVDGGTTSIRVNNLYKSTKYYVRAIGYAGNVILGVTETSAFTTTDIGPRLMTVDGIYNVRDLGGYMTESGKTTLQGLVYRGSEMDGFHGISLTEKGDDIMSNLMGIKYDMDLRGPAECNYVTESPISSAVKTHFPIGGYTAVFNSSYKEYLRQIFAAFADQSNYPIYFHCWGGADRTGTIAYLLNGLCGVDEAALVQDYEMTSYSIFGVRADDSTTYDFAAFVEQLKSYEGNTLSEKIENYLLSLGVTEDEIYNIKAIMFGETPVTIVSGPAEFDAAVQEAMKVTVMNGGTVRTVTMNGEEVAFTVTDNGFEVKTEAMPASLADGQTVTGKVTFTDGTEKEFTFKYIYDDALSLRDYWTTETGSVTLNAAMPMASSDQAVGYGNKVSIALTTVTSGTYGDTYIMVGSYGVHLRASAFRMATMASGGSPAEVSPRVSITTETKAFDVEGGKLILGTEILSDTQIKLTIKAVKTDGTVVTDDSYTFTRISNEISSSNAKVTIKINDTSQVSSLTVKTGTGTP